MESAFETAPDHGGGTCTVRLFGEEKSDSLTVADVRAEALPTTAYGDDSDAQWEVPRERGVVLIEKPLDA